MNTEAEMGEASTNQRALQRRPGEDLEQDFPPPPGEPALPTPGFWLPGLQTETVHVTVAPGKPVLPGNWPAGPGLNAWSQNRALPRGHTHKVLAPAVVGAEPSVAPPFHAPCRQVVSVLTPLSAIHVLVCAAVPPP